MSNRTSILARIQTIILGAPAYQPEPVAPIAPIAPMARKPFYAVGPSEEAYVARIKAAHPDTTIAWSRSSIGGLQADVLGFGRYACSRWSAGVAGDAYMD